MTDYRTPEERLRAAGGTFEKPRPNGNGQGTHEPAAELADHGAELRGRLSIENWAQRELPLPDRLLGDVVTTTSRMFLVGRTGLGKTMLGLAMACGIASGNGFLGWRSTRPGRVLLIDGEMPGELIKARAIDALRRAGMQPLPGNLLIYSSDLEDELAAHFPTLGKMPPLNTEAGHNFVLALIAAVGGVDVVIFDNVMSLIVGDHKDEIPWSETLPLVTSLTVHRIGQIWLDHTGHNTDRQYGSSTKAWRFDTVGMMTPVEDDQRERHEVTFALSFEYPGKARRRTPENWGDFETRIVRLKDDRWTSQSVRSSGAGGRVRKLPPTRMPFYDALVAAIGKAPTRTGETTFGTWELECLRRGLIEQPPGTETTETSQQRGSRYRNFRKAKSDLLGAGWIAIEDDRVLDLKGRWG